MATTIQNQLSAQKADKPTAPSVTALVNTYLDRDGLRKRFDELLGKRSPQFISSIVSMINADSTLQQAFYESPMTVIQAALKAANYDLPIDQSLGFAYIVPFKNYRKDLGKKVYEAIFIMGWRGMNQLALRTGAYKTINVKDIREGELKKFNPLTEEFDFDFIEDETEREKHPVIGYAGYYRLINGAEKTIYKSVKAIENHEKKFRKGEHMGKGWRDNWDAMAMKTVYRELIGKWGIMSIEYQTRDESKMLAEIISDDINAEAVIDAEYFGNPVDGETGEVLEGGETA